MGDEDDVVARAERRIVRRGSAHIDDVSSARFRAGLDNTDLLQNTGLTGADETHRVQRAWKVGTRYAVTGLHDIEYMDDTARLTGMRDLDFDSIKQRFFFQQINGRGRGDRQIAHQLGGQLPQRLPGLDLVLVGIGVFHQRRGHADFPQQLLLGARTHAEGLDVDPLVQVELKPATGKRLRAYFARPGWCDGLVSTYYGPQSAPEFMERTTWHSAQHLRQIYWFLDEIGVAKDAPVGFALRLLAQAGRPMPCNL